MSIALAERHGAHNYHPLPVEVAHAEGCWVTDMAGKRYLDFLSSYSALNQGHRHPRILAAARAQMDRVTLTSRAFHNDQLGPFLAQLSEVSGFPRALPMNSGAEACETAIKALRRWGYRHKGVPDGAAEIIVATDNFHGRTTTIISFSTEPEYREGFGPFTPGFVIVPYGDAAALEAAITPNTVGVFLEPIQGEAGVVVPPEGYLRAVREACDRHGVKLVIDEIQTGLGRTGRMWCFEHEGIRPDGITIGKALGGGFYPVSAFCADEDLIGVFGPGSHGSTFGGNPLAAAIARASLDVIVDEGLAAHAAVMGERLRAGLRALRSPAVKDVRGMGLLVGVELHADAGPARPRCEALLAHGLLCKDTHGQVMRLAPPLVVSESEIDLALARVAEVLT